MKTTLPTNLIAAITALLLVCPSLAQQVAKEGKAAVSIFNGEDLTGWKAPKGNTWWKVVDGAIVCQSGPKKKGSNLWTEKEYTDFVLEAEFRFDGKGDTGIHLRTEKQQMQIGISGSLKRDMTGSMYIPGKGYPKEATGVEKLLKINEWNLVKIEAKKNHYRIWLNGELVFEYTSDKAPEKGPIGLQLHGGKVMRADFRKLKVTEL
ncbi:MAG: hypothetical protein ACI8XO_000766 [Verrucomicrobiales bacterium]|jgi:hypothetical protein